MRVARRGVLAVLLASVLVAGAVGPAVASADPAPRLDRENAGQLSFQDDESTIDVTQEFSLTPSTPGEVRVERRYAVPSRVVSLRTSVPAGANVTDADGFYQSTEDSYRWDEVTVEPSITYTLPVNESMNDTSPDGADGDLVAVDAGEWALFQRPPAPTHWENYAGDEPIEFNRTTTTDGPGATGEWIVFLGDHETYERTAHDQRFTLVVPSNADTAADPETVLDSLVDASDALRVGDRDDEVFVVAAPTDGVRWGVRGLQAGDADLWVRDVEPVASPENPWVHEYVHSRQEFTLAAEMQWFHEAAASYYAALLTYEQSHVRYEGFSERIGAGANGSYADAVLANQSTWRTSPDYDKGALVAGQIDRQIRNARAQERTLQTVVRAMNGHDGPVSLADFLAFLGEHGDEAVVDAAAEYAETPANVTMWNQTAHVMAFGNPPARVGFQLPGEANNATYRVNGSYRNATVADDGDGPIVLVPGERLRVDALVQNAGGRTGNYTASLAVNGTVVDSANGSVAPNETATVPLNHSFERAGTYELTLEGDNRTVEVREPADATVTDLRAASGMVWKGGAAEVSARVENDDAVPGEATVAFRRDDGLVVTETVRLGPESATWVNASVPTSRTGTATISVEGAGAVDVTVRAPPDRATDDPPTATDAPNQTTTAPAVTATADPTDESVSGGTGPGFRGLAVVAAVALAAALAWLRDRR